MKGTAPTPALVAKLGRYRAGRNFKAKDPTLPERRKDGAPANSKSVPTARTGTKHRATRLSSDEEDFKAKDPTLPERRKDGAPANSKSVPTARTGTKHRATRLSNDDGSFKGKDPPFLKSGRMGHPQIRDRRVAHPALRSEVPKLPGERVAQVKESTGGTVFGQRGELGAGFAAFGEFHRGLLAAHSRLHPARMR
jgi:hypothetical protein